MHTKYIQPRELFYNLTKLIDKYGYSCEDIVQNATISILVFTYEPTTETKLGQLLECQNPDIQFPTQIFTDFTNVVSKYLSNPDQYPSVSLVDEIECECQCVNGTISLKSVEITIRPGQLMFVVGKLTFKDSDETQYFLLPNYRTPFFVRPLEYIEVSCGS